MKKILNIGMMLLICSLAMAQSQYISYREYIDKDRKADLLGASGILIYSQQGDLIITLTNVKKPMIQKTEKERMGCMNMKSSLNLMKLDSLNWKSPNEVVWIGKAS